MIPKNIQAQPPSGFETMTESIKDAHHYSGWIFSCLAPFLNTIILEVGPGRGNIAQLIIADKKKYLAIDLSEVIINELKSQLSLPADALLSGDVTQPVVIERLRQKNIGSILMVNVLEHIEDDKAFIRSIIKCAPGGNLILFLPALPLLYGTLDRDAGHYRRYNKSSLKEILSRSDLEIQHLAYFNWVGTISWFICGRLLKMKLNSNASNTGLVLYDRFVIPLSRWIDPLLNRFLGQSIIAIVKIAPNI
jgi:hypothetical protein